MINLREKETKEIIQLYSMAIKELKRRKVIRTNNVVGELGEYLAKEIYNSTPGLPNLSPAPVGTENIDAISRKGDRYSIKYLIIRSLSMLSYVNLMITYELQTVLEMDWNTFLMNKRWHSRMHAWNLSLTKQVRQQCKIVYKKQE